MAHLTRIPGRVGCSAVRKKKKKKKFPNEISDLDVFRSVEAEGRVRVRHEGRCIR